MTCQPSPPLRIRLCRVAGQPACRAPFWQLGLSSGCPLSLTGRWMRTFANFCLVQCTISYNPASFQPWFWNWHVTGSVESSHVFLTFLFNLGILFCLVIVALIIAWVSHFAQFGNILVYCFFSFLDNVPLSVGWKELLGFYSPSCSGLVPVKHRRYIWWPLSQRTENMPACT